jgi:hypothetical protein
MLVLYNLSISVKKIDCKNADRIRELLESEPYISQKTLSRRLNLHHDAVHRILTEEPLFSISILFHIPQRDGPIGDLTIDSLRSRAL